LQAGFVETQLAGLSRREALLRWDFVETQLAVSLEARSSSRKRETEQVVSTRSKIKAKRKVTNTKIYRGFCMTMFKNKYRVESTRFKRP